MGTFKSVSQYAAVLRFRSGGSNAAGSPLGLVTKMEQCFDAGRTKCKGLVTHQGKKKIDFRSQGLTPPGSQDLLFRGPADRPDAMDENPGRQHTKDNRRQQV